MFLTDFTLSIALLSTQQLKSLPDISRCNAIAHAVMQNLDNQIWKSRIAISTKLKLYNTCNSTERDVLKIDALDQWCL